MCQTRARLHAQNSSSPVCVCTHVCVCVCVRPNWDFRNGRFPSILNQFTLGYRFLTKHSHQFAISINHYIESMFNFMSMKLFSWDTITLYIFNWKYIENLLRISWAYVFFRENFHESFTIKFHWRFLDKSLVIFVVVDGWWSWLMTDDDWWLMTDDDWWLMTDGAYG